MIETRVLLACRPLCVRQTLIYFIGFSLYQRTYRACAHVTLFDVIRIQPAVMETSQQLFLSNYIVLYYSKIYIKIIHTNTETRNRARLCDNLSVFVYLRSNYVLFRIRWSFYFFLCRYELYGSVPATEHLTVFIYEVCSYTGLHKFKTGLLVLTGYMAL